ncbi:MAG: hypothetical protein QXS69_01390 [Candidatus Aenigmatarchaeota archaeon]
MKAILHFLLKPLIFLVVLLSVIYATAFLSGKEYESEVLVSKINKIINEAELSQLYIIDRIKKEKTSFDFETMNCKFSVVVKKCDDKKCLASISVTPKLRISGLNIRLFKEIIVEL